MERLDLGQPFTVIVDYAHSPASLSAVLDGLAPSAAARGGRLIVVFGSAGERDTAKRPAMGRIAGERAWLVVLADEDPRGEDPMAILEAIARGAEATGKRRDHDLLLIPDRRAAITAAFERAGPGDVVLLAGKGHERSIIGADGAHTMGRTVGRRGDPSGTSGSADPRCILAAHVDLDAAEHEDHDRETAGREPPARRSPRRPEVDQPGQGERGAAKPRAPARPTAPTKRRGPRRAPAIPSSSGGGAVDLGAMRATLRQTILDHHPTADLTKVDEAFELAVEAHEGQRRATGEPYVTHPIASAQILAELGIDPVAIEAALLHDVPEDTEYSLTDIEERFGAEVAQLVDGVTKLSKFSTHSHEQQQAENIRKMFLAMADDIRVVLIKLADRLHNMRTLYGLPSEKQQRIARETMEIYAPLADRLGIWQMKWELEDLAFAVLKPERFRELAKLLDTRRKGRETYIERVIAELHRSSTQRASRPTSRAGRSTSTRSTRRWSARARVRRDLRRQRHPPDRRGRSRLLRDPGHRALASGGLSQASSTTTSPSRRTTCTSRCTPP